MADNTDFDDNDNDTVAKSNSQKEYDELHRYLIALLAASENNNDEQLSIEDVDEILRKVESYASLKSQEQIQKSLLKATGLSKS